MEDKIEKLSERISFMKEKVDRAFDIWRDAGHLAFLLSSAKYFKTITYDSAKFKIKNLIYSYGTIINGIKIRDNKYLNTYIRGKLENGTYEEAEFNLIDKYIDSEDNVIELGGGIGYISCVISQRLSEEAIQIVLEANPNLIKIIEDSRAINNCDFNIVESAYHSGDENAELIISDSFWSSSTFSNDKSGVEVPAMSLKDLKQEFRFEKFKLVSDIEGGELEILNEIDLLKEYCEMLIVETHPDMYSQDEKNRLSNQLTNNRFKLIDKEDNVLVFSS